MKLDVREEIISPINMLTVNKKAALNLSGFFYALWSVA
jgi:hypothetical protein